MASGIQVNVTILLTLLFSFTHFFGYCASIPFELTPQEQVWLKENTTIKISGPQKFPPFQHFDEGGEFKGMASDYVYHIADMIGLKVEVERQRPWLEILQKIEKKEIDVLTCAANTPERAHYLNFTKSHLSFPVVIISRRGAPFISGTDSLHHKKLAVNKNVPTLGWLKRDGVDVVPLFVNSPLEALQKVSLGQADVAVENLAAATYLIEKNGLTNLKIAAPTPYENYALSIAVRKDWPELVGIFNKGLAAIAQEKHNEIRQRWVSVRYEHGISVLDIVKWVALVATIAVIIVAIFFLSNRQLSREIQERKRAENEKEKLIVELTGALDEIKTLRGILPICSECKKIRDDKGYWTQIEEYIGLHLDADFSHSICPNCMRDLYGDEGWYTDSKKCNDDGQESTNTG